MKKTGSYISLIVSILVSAGAFYLAFRNVPLADLTAYLGSINYWWLIPSVALILAGFLLRVVRWRVILASTHEVTLMNAFHPLMVGFMINCILPGRVGELARPLILQQRNGVPFSTGLATVTAERIFDLMLLMVLFALVAGAIHIDPGHERTFMGYHLDAEMLQRISTGMMRLGIILVAGMILINIRRLRNWIHQLIFKLPLLLVFTSPAFKEKISEKICRPLSGFVENFAAGMGLIREPGRMALCIGISAAIWTIQATSMYALAMGCPGIGLSLMEIIAMMVFICFFIALPSVPGYWGLWEAAGVFVLSLFGIGAREAAGFTLANHAVQLFPVIIVGIVSAMMIGVNILRVSRHKGTTEETHGPAMDENEKKGEPVNGNVYHTDLSGQNTAK